MSAHFSGRKQVKG